MHETSAPEAYLNLGTLAYLGSPTLGSVIVYSSAQNRWGRVPMQDVSVNVNDSVGHSPHQLWCLLRSDRLAQCMLLVLMLALMLVGMGSYGFSKNSAQHAVPPRSVGSPAVGEAPRSEGSLAIQGAQGNVHGPVRPLSY